VRALTKVGNAASPVIGDRYLAETGVYVCRDSLDRESTLPTENRMTANSVHLLIFAIGLLAGLKLLLEVPKNRHRRNQEAVDDLRETAHAVQELEATHAVQTHRPSHADDSSRPEPNAPPTGLV
jgi:hypothetical protein